MDNMTDEYDDSWYYDDNDLTEQEELDEAGFHDDEDQDKIVDDPFGLEEDWDEEDFDEE